MIVELLIGFSITAIIIIVITNGQPIQKCINQAGWNLNYIWLYWKGVNIDEVFHRKERIELREFKKSLENHMRTLPKNNSYLKDTFYQGFIATKLKEIDTFPPFEVIKSGKKVLKSLRSYKLNFPPEPDTDLYQASSYHTFQRMVEKLLSSYEIPKDTRSSKRKKRYFKKLTNSVIRLEKRITFLLNEHQEAWLFQKLENVNFLRSLEEKLNHLPKRKVVKTGDLLRGQCLELKNSIFSELYKKVYDTTNYQELRKVLKEYEKQLRGNDKTTRKLLVKKFQTKKYEEDHTRNSSSKSRHYHNRGKNNEKIENVSNTLEKGNNKKKEYNLYIIFNVFSLRIPPSIENIFFKNSRK